MSDSGGVSGPDAKQPKVPGYGFNPLSVLDPSDTANHFRIILFSVIVTRSLYFAIFSFCQAHLPVFDSSAWIYTREALLRWDVFHFAHIAVEQRCNWEHEYAFCMGMPLAMSGMSFVLRSLSGMEKTVATLVVGGVGIAWTAGMCAHLELYNLTRDVTRRPRFALLVAILYCFPSSPPALVFAPYTEPVFALLSFGGMRDCVRGNFLPATIKFTVAAAFRANGLMLVGYLGWYLVIEPDLSTRQILMRNLYCMVLVGVVCLPFVQSQMTAYRNFCVDRESPRPWCSSLIPLIYSFVQNRYWDVGFLRYWTLSQLPNFLIAAPAYAMMFWSTIDTLLSKDKRQLPFAIHTLGFSLLLLFTANVQIALRLVSTLPTPYWAAASLLMGEQGSSRRFWGIAWLGWSIVWGVISCALWVAFLPPA